MFVKEHFVRQFAQCLKKIKFNKIFTWKCINKFDGSVSQFILKRLISTISDNDCATYICFLHFIWIFRTLLCTLVQSSATPTQKCWSKYEISCLIHLEKKQLFKTLQFIISIDIMKIKINSASCATHLCPLPQQVLD